jgi:hypothetical protein
MGIFDVFKTKVSEAAHKSGELAGDAEEKSRQVVGDMKARMADRRRDDGADRDADEAGATMVSEGGPVSSTGEAAPGAGDPAGAAGPGTRNAGGSGGMVGSIKQNAASGVEKAGGFVDERTGGKYSDQIQSGVKKAKDALG